MLKYGRNTPTFKPAKLHARNVDRQSVACIDEGSRVLEIGCATGFMGEYLIKHRKCDVFGVELGKEESQIASKKLNKVIRGDVEDQATIKQVIKLGKFDVVFASALIEHLKDPWKALKQWKRFLKPNGHLIVSTSNIAHWSQRKNMLQGNFQYQEYGILDNTHLRFFTTKTFKKLVEECGYEIEYFGIDPVGGGYPKLGIIGSIFFPNLFAYQMVIKAKA